MNSWTCIYSSSLTKTPFKILRLFAFLMSTMSIEDHGPRCCPFALKLCNTTTLKIKSYFQGDEEEEEEYECL